jgi:hypothetical protein
MKSLAPSHSPTSRHDLMLDRAIIVDVIRTVLTERV